MCGDIGLRLSVVFPDCWDGENVDSPDHRAHVAYSDRAGCPDSHPVPIPLLELVIDYGVVDPDGLALSSGPVDIGARRLLECLGPGQAGDRGRVVPPSPTGLRCE